MWKGDRLFPPARKSKKPRKTREFGGFRKDQAGQLITDHTICSISGKPQKYRNTPTNLQQHILAGHPDQWRGENETNLKETKMDDFYLPQANKYVKKYKQDNPKQKKFNEIITEWVVKNKRPLKIVEDPKLIEALELADDKLNVPSRYN